MNIQLAPVDLFDAGQAGCWLSLLDHYAQDPMGGGEGLSDFARLNLISTIREVPGYHGAMAWCDGEAVGLINCFAGFSTFAALPLLNVHDIVVLDRLRGRGIGQALLAWAEARARELGCCKLTLEVLSRNERALASYWQAGYVNYMLDPAAGHAILMQKPLEEK